MDSVTGTRDGGFWYADAELMKTNWPTLPSNSVEVRPHMLGREGEELGRDVEAALAEHPVDALRVADVGVQHLHTVGQGTGRAVAAVHDRDLVALVQRLRHAGRADHARAADEECPCRCHCRSFTRSSGHPPEGTG